MTAFGIFDILCLSCYYPAVCERFLAFQSLMENRASPERCQRASRTLSGFEPHRIPFDARFGAFQKLRLLPK